MQVAVFALDAKNVDYQYCHVDLRNKAQWHKDVNGGLIPVLETPQGDLIPESSVIS